MTCIHVKCLSERLRTKFQNDFIMSSLTPQITILGLCNEATIIFWAMFYWFLNIIFMLREQRKLHIDTLLATLTKVKIREKQISLVPSNNREAYKKMVRYIYFTSNWTIHCENFSRRAIVRYRLKIMQEMQFLKFLLSYLRYCSWLYFSWNLFWKKMQKKKKN